MSFLHIGVAIICRPLLLAARDAMSLLTIPAAGVQRGATHPSGRAVSGLSIFFLAKQVPLLHKTDLHFTWFL